MIFKYILFATVQLAGKLATFLFAPLACLFVVYREETSVTGYPSEFPGMPRAFLVRPLRWMQSFDDCLDAYWYSGKSAWLQKWFDQAYRSTSTCLKIFRSKM